jgi:hypothetical protein
LSGPWPTTRRSRRARSAAALRAARAAKVGSALRSEENFGIFYRHKSCRKLVPVKNARDSTPPEHL